MKVSIIMPAYNAEKVCARAISSVLAQNYADYELIIIDDGSRDSTYQVCHKFQKKDNRIKLYHQENQGVSAARNTGLRKATGEYVAFLDADDFYDNNYLQVMTEQAERKEADIVICGYKSIMDNQVSAIWKPSVENSLNLFLKSLFLNVPGLYTLWNKLFRRDLIHMEFPIGVSMGEDLEFICDFLPRVKKFSIVHEPLYNYVCDSAGSLTKRTDIVVNSILHDYFVKLQYVEKTGLEKVLLDDVICGRTLSILVKCKTYQDYESVFNRLVMNQSYLAELRKANPHKIGGRIVKKLILWRKKVSLYLLILIKKGRNN